MGWDVGIFIKSSIQLPTWQVVVGGGAKGGEQVVKEEEEEEVVVRTIMNLADWPDPSQYHAKVK